MRLPRPTTRRMMELVAAVAVLLGAVMLKQRSKSYRARAALHAASRQMYLRKAEQTASGQAGHYRELASYHERLRQIYERAARRPWLPVPPDPPAPE